MIVRRGGRGRAEALLSFIHSFTWGWLVGWAAVTIPTLLELWCGGKTFLGLEGRHAPAQPCLSLFEWGRLSLGSSLCIKVMEEGAGEH